MTSSGPSPNPATEARRRGRRTLVAITTVPGLIPTLGPAARPATDRNGTITLPGNFGGGGATDRAVPSPPGALGKNIFPDEVRLVLAVRERANG